MDLESSINLFLWQKLEEISDAAWDVCCLLLRRYIYIFMVGICFNGLKIVLFFALGLVLMNQEAFSSRVSLVAAHSVVPVYIYIYTTFVFCFIDYIDGQPPCQCQQNKY